MARVPLLSRKPDPIKIAMSHTDHPIRLPLTPICISRDLDLEPLLRGHVFHVTTEANYQSIARNGGISPNSGSYASPFGDLKNGYFRKAGCVSFFDYRDCTNPAWRRHRTDCRPTLALGVGSPLVILFLDEAFWDRLILWRDLDQKEASMMALIPHVECGIAGLVTLDMISKCLLVGCPDTGSDFPNRAALAEMYEQSRLQAASRERISGVLAPKRPF